jgi:hypothetical protein
MAQHDQVIDNGTGLTVRTDINNALAALFSSSSGPVEPTVKVPGQVWFDTTLAKLKFRNVANNAWNELFIAGGSSVPMILTGNDANGQIVFSGTQGSLATGKPLGLSWTQSDLFFGVRAADTPTSGMGKRWVWNTKGDASGYDIMMLDAGNAALYMRNTAANPYLIFERDKAPVVADWCGSILFNQRSGAGAVAFAYGQMTCSINVATAGSEQGALSFGVRNGAAMKNVATMTSTNCNFYGTIQSVSAGRIISHTDYTQGQPSFTMHAADRAQATGMWLPSNAHRIAFGYMDGGGGPAGYWAYLDGAAFHSFVNFSSSGSVLAVGNLYALNGDMMLAVAGSGRIMQFAAGWYWDWNASNGDLTWMGSIGWLCLFKADGGTFQVRHSTAAKNGAGSWVSWSDARMKNIGADYEPGLAEIIQLQPKHYTMKDDPTNRDQVSLIAQDCENVMPDLVTKQKGIIDGVEVDDVRQFDPTNLTYALINAVKEIAERLDALEEPQEEAA